MLVSDGGVLDFVAKDTPVFAKQHCFGGLPPQTELAVMKICALSGIVRHH